MPRDITVTFADGTSHTYQNAPDDLTPDMVESRASKDFGKPVKSLDGGEKPAETSLFQDIKEGAGNLLAGGVRGAGSIGATLLAPIDIAKDALDGKGLSLESNRQRRADMDAALQSFGADPKSFAYKAGKLTGEIAGTAGVGGLIGNGVSRAIPMVAKVLPNSGNAMSVLSKAIQSGGLTLGSNAPANPIASALVRSLGGAINGAVSSGLVNPEEAGNGALIGGALPVAVKTAGAVGGLIKQSGSGALKHALGMSTGTGGESVSTAYKAGKEGATSFLENLRGDVPMTDVIDSAKSALGQMRMDRAAQYRAGMSGVSADKTVVDFAPIDKAIASLKSMGSYKGQVINKNASGAVDEVSDLVTKWKGLNPAEYHTPEGLDALKQAISDIRDTTQFGTAARRAVDTAYNAVKGEITTQAPTYAKVMKDYGAASETLAEIERSLSLGNKAAADTSMRKLQSLMRNNVNTNFGNRLDMAKVLENNGAEILPAVAGQSMASWTPRGLAGLTASGGAIGALLANPPALAALTLTSPRLVGELAYRAGAANRGLSTASTKLGQLLSSGNQGQITLEQLAPLLSTAPVIAATQR